MKDYVAGWRQRSREMFVPLVHPPGHAQVDFGEAIGVIGGVERKIHFFAFDLPHSDACFVAAYPAETTEAFCDGHVRAFAFFGGVPKSILYDNTKIAVARILGDGKRQRTRVFTELQSRYLFEDRFGRPGKGNDKGKVEGVVISCGSEVIARHLRSYQREDFVFEPLHYLVLIEQKVNALDQAAPLAGWQLPEDFATLRRLLEARMGKQGKQEFVQVLRLIEAFKIEDVTAAVRDAIARGAIGFDAVKHLVLCRIERRPPRLDMRIYPYLPRATVAMTSAKAYMDLCRGAAS